MLRAGSAVAGVVVIAAAASAFIPPPAGAFAAAPAAMRGLCEKVVVASPMLMMAVAPRREEEDAGRRRKATPPMSGSSSNSRRDALVQEAAAGAVMLGLLTSITPYPAWADSTGKYSTKQTAKRRYLPRIKRGVLAFQDLGKTIKASPDKAVAAAEGFGKLLEDDLKGAMRLYGASTKSGELPDPSSRSLDRDVDDFVKAVQALPSAAAGGKGGAAYEEASKVLEAYLVGAKLPPIASPDYKAE